MNSRQESGSIKLGGSETEIEVLVAFVDRANESWGEKTKKLGF